MARIGLVLVCMLGLLGCEPSVKSAMRLLGEAMEGLDAERVREINASRQIIRSQCEMLRILIKSRPDITGVDVDAVCLAYETGVLARDAVAFVFRKGEE